MSSRAKNDTKATNNPISKALKGVGVEWIRQIDRTYDVPRMREVIHEAHPAAFESVAGSRRIRVTQLELK